jgi:hypothetical protein
MGNPVGIALFSFMAGVLKSDSKVSVLILAAVVSAVVIFGSIGLVRYSNRGRQLTPAIADASRSLLTIPDSLFQGTVDTGAILTRRDEFARQLAEGLLPVDSVRAFYQSYALWMRDGRWDLADVRELSSFLGAPTAP